LCKLIRGGSSRKTTVKQYAMFTIRRPRCAILEPDLRLLAASLTFFINSNDGIC
jgi:hypothetical protein